MSSDLILHIKNPHIPHYVYSISVPRQTTVASLKRLLFTSYRSHPPPSSQRLVSLGRLLNDSEMLQDVFNPDSGQREDLVIHLAVKGETTTTADQTAPSVPSAAVDLCSQPALVPSLTSSTAASGCAALAPDCSPRSAPASTSGFGGSPASSLPLAFAPYGLSPYAGFSPFCLPMQQQAQPVASMTPAQIQALYWQQMAAVAAMQQYGLRQRQSATVNTANTLPSFIAPSPSSSSSLPSGAHSGATSMNASLSLSSSHPPLLTAATAPFFLPPLAFTSPSPLTPHIPITPSALPPFAPSSSSTTQSAGTINPLAATTTGPTASSSVPAGGSSSPPAAMTTPAQPSRLSRYMSNVKRYIDVRLLVKLGVLLLVFSRQGDSYRSLMLMGAAVLAYLWQVGLFRRRGAGEGEAEGGGGAAAEGGVREREAMAQARREAREERRAGGGGGGLGGLLGGMGDEDDDDEDDIALQREQLHILQQQHQAEMIRRGVRRGTEGGGDGAGGATAEGADVGWIIVLEKFIVGFFASFVPSWRPTIAAA